MVGGSGAGKSRFYAKVNLCQANTSYFVLDYKGKLLRDRGPLLERQGYEIRIVDLIAQIADKLVELQNAEDNSLLLLRKPTGVLLICSTPFSWAS